MSDFIWRAEMENFEETYSRILQKVLDTVKKIKYQKSSVNNSEEVINNPIDVYENGNNSIFGNNTYNAENINGGIFYSNDFDNNLMKTSLQNNCNSTLFPTNQIKIYSPKIFKRDVSQHLLNFGRFLNAEDNIDTNLSVENVYIFSSEVNGKFKKIKRSSECLDENCEDENISSGVTLVNQTDKEMNFIIGSLMKSVHQNDTLSFKKILNESLGDILQHHDNVNVYILSDNFYTTILNRAIQMRNLEMVSALLEADADPTISDIGGRAALHYCAKEGTMDILQLLLSNNKTDVNQAGSVGETALHVSVVLNKLDMAKILLKNGADPYLASESGQNALHLASAVDLQLVKLIIQVSDKGINDTDDFQRSPLYISVFNNIPEITKFLLENNADPDVPDFYGRTPLIISLSQDIDDITDLLLSYLPQKVDPYFANNPLGTTPFHLAVMGGKLKFVKTILNSSKSGIDALTRQGVTPLQMAVSNNDTEMVKVLLQNGAEPYIELLDRKWTVLHVIAEKDLAAIGRIVLSHDSSGIDFQNDMGQTALYRSALRNATQVFDLLMSHNANTTIGTTSGNTPLLVSTAVGSYHMVNAILKDNTDVLEVRHGSGETALVVAAVYNHTDIFRLILSKGAKTDTVNNKGQTALHAATRSTNTVIADLLLKANPSLINMQDEAGKTALHVAGEARDGYMMDYLLRHGSDPRITDKDGLTALQELVTKNHVALVELHLKLNNSGINQRFKEGLTAAYVSTIYNNTDLFEILMKHGANPYIPDDAGMTALHLAAFQNRSEIVEQILSVDTSGINMQTKTGQTALHTAFQYPTICGALLQHGANESTRDDNGKTVLHYSVRDGVVDTVRLILDRKSPVVNISDENGQRPLHFAVDANQTEIFTLLLNASAFPYPVTITGITPLHLAAKNSNKHFVDILLSLNKSFIDQQTYDGNTALHLAIDNNATDIVELLFEEGADPGVADYNGATSYHFAVMAGHLHTLDLFLRKNISAINIKTAQGTTLLAMAALKAKEHIFDFLLAKGADYTLVNNKGHTIIHDVVFGENEMILRKVLHKAANLINTTDFSGLTPLLAALKSKNLFDILFDRGADPFTPFHGGSILHLAAYYDYLHVFQKILDKFNDTVDTMNHLGVTPLSSAIFSGNKNSTRYLIKKGADVLRSSFFNENYLHHSQRPVDDAIIVDILFKEINKTFKGDLPASFLNQQNALGLTPISKAAVNGKEYLFKTLWNVGADPYIKTVSEDNILHQAARGGDKYILDFVLNHIRISVNSKNYNGITPLMKAAESGVEYAFDKLLSLGARLGETSSHKETLLHFAAAGGNVNILRKVLAHPKTNIDATDVEGFTPLMYACIHARFDATGALLRENADYFVKNIYGETAVELSAKQAQFDIVTLFPLINFSDDFLLGSLLGNAPSDLRKPDDAELIKTILAHSSISKNPIIIAAALGDDVSLIKALEKYPVSKKMKKPYLMKQFMKEYDALIEELLVNDPINVSGFEKYITPLDFALLFFGKASTVKILMEKLEMNFELMQRSRAMWTPLDFVIFSMSRFKDSFREKERILHFLLKNDKRPIEKPNTYGWTIVHKAAWFGNIDVIQFLKSEGFDLQAVDNYGRTPLHIASLKGFPRTVDLLLRDSKGSVNRRDLYGFTPLHLVQIYGRRKFFSRLSFAKSDMDAEDRYDFLENVDIEDLDLGVRTRSYLETMFALIDNGADVNSQDSTFGWTPLHWAAINGDMWKLVTLIRKGALLNLPSRSGVTPLWLARNWGRKVIYHYLKANGGVW